MRGRHVNTSPAVPSANGPTADGFVAGSGTHPHDRAVAAVRRPRIVGVDVARGLALVGMFGAHLAVASGPGLTLFDPSSWLDVVNGRSSILFALLAGVSLALMTVGIRDATADELRRVRLRLVGRGAAIFVVGLGVELLGSGIAVILSLYGVLYVLAAFTVHLRTKTLLIAGGGLIVLGPPLLALVGTLSPDLSGPGLALVVFGTYPITVWAALLCAGLIIGRLDLTRVRTGLMMVVGGTLLCLGAYTLGAILAPPQGDASSSTAPSSSSGMVPGDEIDISGLTCNKSDGIVACVAPERVSLFGGADSEDSYFDWVVSQDPPAATLNAVTGVSPHSGGVLEIVGSGGFAVAVLGLCLLVTRYARWAVLPLAAYGAVPLTGYVVQAILIRAGASAWLPNPVLSWVVLSILMMIAALIWTRTAGKGPLERLAAHAADAMALTTKQKAQRRPGQRFPSLTSQEESSSITRGACAPAEEEE